MVLRSDHTCRPVMYYTYLTTWPNPMRLVKLLSPNLLVWEGTIRRYEGQTFQAIDCHSPRFQFVLYYYRGVGRVPTCTRRYDWRDG